MKVQRMVAELQYQLTQAVLTASPPRRLDAYEMQITERLKDIGEAEAFPYRGQVFFRSFDKAVIMPSGNPRLHLGITVYKSSQSNLG